MEPLGAVSQNWKVEAIPVSAQWAGWLSRVGSHRDTSTRPPLGTINVILAALGRTSSRPSRVLSIAQPFIADLSLGSKRSRVGV